MIRIFFVMTLAFAFGSSSAQVIQRNILGSGYTEDSVGKVLKSRADFQPYPRTPEAWEKQVPKTIMDKIIQKGIDNLSYTFLPVTGSISMDFKRSGDRERHSGVSFGKRNALMQLIVAESMEGKGRFMENIFNGIWSICEESYWGVPAHIGGTGLPDVERPVVDLFTAETAAVLALADYFVGTKLDTINPLIRKRIRFETDKRLFSPMLTYGDQYGWMSRTRPVNNWNPWIMSNWILSTLLLESDQQKRTHMVHRAMTGLDAYLNSLGDEGGCDEGPSYWFAAGASAFDCLELLHQSSSGRIDIYSHPLIRNMAGYITKTHIGGNHFVNFADADPKLTPDGYLLQRFGQAVNDSAMMQFGAWAMGQYGFKELSGFMRMRQLMNLLSAGNPTMENRTYNPPSFSWMGDVQIMTARTNDGLFLATHGGHNAESHNHNDVGDFIIYLQGEPMVIDAGRGNYTARTFSSKRYELWFTRSEYHNLPIVNGFGQKEGRAFEAKDVQVRNSEKESALSMDIADAYPSEAGLESWKRTVSLNRKKALVELESQYQFKSQPSSLEEVFMTVCKVDTTKKGIILLESKEGRKLQLAYDARQWSLQVDQPSFEGMEYSSFIAKWDGQKINRIMLKQLSPKQKGEHKFTFLPIKKL